VSIRSCGDKFVLPTTPFQGPGLPQGGRHPTVRMHLEGFEVVNTANPLQEAELSLTPNPATDVLNLQLQLKQTMLDDLQISINDMMGRLMHSEKQQNVQTGQFTFDVSSYPAGTYFMQLQSENGLRALKFIVAE
jgi:hypothetical protein